MGRISIFLADWQVVFSEVIRTSLKEREKGVSCLPL